MHLDIDNFYCAVEVADEPALRGVPLAVTQGNAGGFVALSAEAKAAGIRKGDGVGERGRRSIAALVAMGFGAMSVGVVLPGGGDVYGKEVKSQEEVES